MFDKIVLRRVFVLSLPALCAVLANCAANAHFKNFCIIKFLTHHSCFGCGLTRAFAALSRLQFKEAYELNPLVFPVTVFLIFAWVMIVKKEFNLNFSNKKGTD